MKNTSGRRRRHKNVKIEKIDENKIKVVLSYDDILELNLDITQISPESEETEKLFSDVFNQASEKLGFVVDDSKFMIEAIPSYTEGFVMFVTKLTESQKKAKLTEHYEIYAFSNLEILQFAVTMVKEKSDCYVKIYKLDGLFYLVLPESSCDEHKNIKIILLDFGKLINPPEIFEGIQIGRASCRERV